MVDKIYPDLRWDHGQDHKHCWFCILRAMTWEIGGAVGAPGEAFHPDPENEGRPSCRREGEAET